jgi:DNA-binding NarL/FixJ family response regulator
MTRGDERPDFRAAVWIVEDSRLYRDTLATVIDRSERLRCARVFPDGESAVAVLRDGHELPRLVLMDIGLPGMGGIECTRQIRKLTPAIPVVMLTVHQSNDRIFEAICAGASGYLLKSETSDAIVRGIEVALDGGAAIDAQIARRVLDMFTQMASGPKVDYGLSGREREILEHLVAGHTKGEIAERLALSPHTIDGHVRSIYSKLHVNNRSGAVAKALKERIL